MLALLLTALWLLAAPVALATHDDARVVRAVQRALNAAGYDCGTPTGYLGAATRQAIASFQIDRGMEETGDITDAVLEALHVSADPEANGITFQGIPWGATVGEAEAILVRSGMIDPDSLFYSDGGTQVWPAEEDNLYRDIAQWQYIYGVGGMAYAASNKTVGGHPTTQMELYFIYGVDGSKIDRTPHLTLVNLYFDGEGVFDDLSGKLAHIYGTYTEKKAEFDTVTIRIWHGDNGTGVCLIDAGRAGVSLHYGRTGDGDTLAAIRRIAAEGGEGRQSAVEDAGL